MKYSSAREIAEDVALEILEAVGTERVKDMIYDQVFKEHGSDEVVQKLVFEQFQRLMKRLREHIRGPHVFIKRRKNAYTGPSENSSN